LRKFNKEIDEDYESIINSKIKMQEFLDTFTEALWLHNKLKDFYDVGDQNQITITMSFLRDVGKNFIEVFKG
jgi:hypothetical protein